MTGKNILVFLAILTCFSFGKKKDGVFVTKDTVVSFLSNANFENISAKSTSMSGTLDIHKRTFNFTVPICGFEGFKNATQKKHYCANYVEGAKFPISTFKGKIIEEFDMSVAGTYTVRCKGNLSLHGIEKELIITTAVVVKEGQITATAKFPIVLADFGMKISGMNKLMIAKTVDVDVKFNLVPEA